MLQPRIHTLTRRPQDLDIRERHPLLKKHEGWFEIASNVPADVIPYFNEYKSSGSTLKFTRWLTRVKKLDNAVVSEIGKSLVTTTAKFSCQHNDLIRLGDTQHYKSCMSNPFGFGRQQLLYLADPDIALLYVPDAAGKFVWRCLIRLAYSNTGVLSLVAYRIYGNGPTASILKALSARSEMPVYRAVDIRERHHQDPAQTLVSPTIINNPILKQPIWTDHLLGLTKQDRISIVAHKNPV